MKRRELELHENTLAQTTQETQQQVRGFATTHTHTASISLHALALRDTSKLFQRGLCCSAPAPQFL